MLHVAITDAAALQPGRRRVGKADEFNKVAPAPPAPPQAPAAPAPAAGENGARPADDSATSLPRFWPMRVPKLAPGLRRSCAVQRPAASKSGRRPRMKKREK